MNGIWIWLPLASIAVINSKMFKNNILKRSKIYWGWFTNFHFRMIKRGSKKLEKGYSFVLPWFLCINNPEQVSSCIKHTCLKHLLHTFERAIIRGISRCRKNLFLLLIWILRTTCVDYHWPYVLRQDVLFSTNIFLCHSILVNNLTREVRIIQFMFLIHQEIEHFHLGGFF